MDTNWKVLTLACFAAFGAGGLQAGLIWDSGFGGSSGFTDCVALDNTHCGGVVGKATTIFDNFTVPAGNWVLGSVSFVDFFNSTNVSAYTGTNWSIWSSDPGTGAVGVNMLASGSALSANVTKSIVGDLACTTNCTVKFTVNLGVVLGAGTYYIATTNSFSGTGETARASADSSSTNGKSLQGYYGYQTNSATTGSLVVQYPQLGNTAFSIDANLTPEPSTWALMLISVAGLALIRRRRSA